MKMENIEHATKNIVTSIGNPPSNSVYIICSKGKTNLANYIFDYLNKQRIECHLIIIGYRTEASILLFKPFLENIANESGIILLLDEKHLKFLEEIFGRPDLGLKLQPKYYFPGSIIQEESIIRVNGIDMTELKDFRARLLGELEKAKNIEISSEAGTNIMVTPRSWKSTNGEVYTAVAEYISEGTIIVDACAYDGPPQIPFTLNISKGRVGNILELNQSYNKQALLIKDLSRDKNSNVLAEFGIGINPGAKWDTGVMESERSRGTCHFGFGNNSEWGGMNKSSYHVDVVIRNPTITVNEKVICYKGKYRI